LGIGPQFNEIPSEFQAAGAELFFLPWLTEPQSIIENLLGTAKNIKPNAIYLDNPNNPTGHFIPKNELRKLIEYCAQNEVLLMVDEAFGDFIDDDSSAATLIEEFDNLLVLRSFSKGFGLAPLRIGYVCMSRNLAPLFSKVAPPFEPSLFSIAAALLSQRKTEIIELIRKDVGRYKAELLACLHSVGIEEFVTHPNVPLLLLRSVDHKSIGDFFSQRDILVQPITAFSLTLNQVPGDYVRLCIPYEQEERRNLLLRLQAAAA
jgi:histidinol-phosphate aminotransferase